MTSELKLWAAFNALHLQPSSKEIQLCCLILENKTTEEIAALQYIATSTVRSNRSRLRQKLQLNQETDLQTFLSELIKKILIIWKVPIKTSIFVGDKNKRQHALDRSERVYEYI